MKLIRATTILLMLCIHHFDFAQTKNEVRGLVVDSLNVPIALANIQVKTLKDTVAIAVGVTNEKGEFRITLLEHGAFLIVISYLGFRTYKQLFDLTRESIRDLGVIQLSSAVTMLQTIEVKGVKSTVSVNGDTIEFNAGSFKIRTNANVEELLKKLPGINVESDGTVRVQGTPVQKVLVDGREFFGRDPKIATRNLPADAVQKVQVFDRNSDQATFTGVLDGQKEKTINLALKDDRKKGLFGNAMAGIGSAERVQSKLLLNRFSKESQYSIIGMGNNVNEIGFSVEESMSFRGEGGNNNSSDDNNLPVNLGSRQNGIITSGAGGVNVNEQLGNELALNVNVFSGSTNQDINRSILRKNIVSQGETDIIQQISGNNLNSTSRAGLTLNQASTKPTSIKLNFAYLEQKSMQKAESSSVSYFSYQPDTTTNARDISTRTNQNQLNGGLLLRHRFVRSKKSLSLQLNGERISIAQNDMLGSLTDFKSGSSVSSVILNQQNYQDNLSMTGSANLSYVQTVRKKIFLELSGSIKAANSEVERNVNDVVNSQELHNDTLSIKYSTEYLAERAMAKLFYNDNKNYLTLGAAHQWSSLHGIIESKNFHVTRSFAYVLPSFRFKHNFTGFRQVQLDYQTSIKEPTLQQLQPTVNNIDPMNIVEGNPALQPEYIHRVVTDFSILDPLNRINFFCNVSYAYNRHAITEAQSINENLVRSSTPVNVSGSQRIAGSFSVGYTLSQPKSHVFLGPNFSALDGISIVNNAESKFFQTILGYEIKYNFSGSENFFLDLSFSQEIKNTKYDLNNRQDQGFINLTSSVNVGRAITEKFWVGSSVNYYQYKNSATNLSYSIPLLSLGLSYYFLKSNSLELKLDAINVLNQNTGFMQISQSNFLQQEKLNNLGRYFMASITYGLNKVIKKSSQDKGMRMTFQH